MTSLYRSLNNKAACELALSNPDFEVCRECSGSGKGWYGACDSCDGFGSHQRDISKGWTDYNTSLAFPSLHKTASQWDRITSTLYGGK